MEKDFTPLLTQFKGTEQTLKIEIHEYNHTCGDGCCDLYGTIVKVNGIELPGHESYGVSILEKVLLHLNYKPEIKETYDFD